jgi:oligopeptide/dipeptide ABC transporter ATP-binding protein
MASRDGNGGALLSVENLGVQIGPFEVLVDVSFTLDGRDSHGLVGETGSGKSLTCRAIVGLLGQLGARAVRGSIDFDGCDLLSDDKAMWGSLRGRRIAFVPQSTASALDPIMTVGKQMEETIRLLDDTVSSPRSRAHELLDAVQITAVDRVLGSYPHELSGGMRQRVMIALALVGRPDLLVADEPTTALDVTVQRGVVDLLNRLRGDLGMALIVVSHDLQLVEMLASRITVMYSGSTVETGPSSAMLSHPIHPYSQALVASELAHTRRGQPLRAIAGVPPAPDQRPPGCSFAPRCAFATPECSVGAIPWTNLDDRGVACIHHNEMAVS